MRIRQIIRNERSLNRIRQYIAENPLDWQEDAENPARGDEDDKAGMVKDERDGSSGERVCCKDLFRSARWDKDEGEAS